MPWFNPEVALLISHYLENVCNRKKCVVLSLGLIQNLVCVLAEINVLIFQHVQTSNNGGEWLI